MQEFSNDEAMPRFALGPGERFFAVQTLTRRELGAAAQLKRQGFRAFVPHIEKSVRHARAFRRVRTPLFTNYLFVILDLNKHRWRSVNGTFGVVHLIMAGDRPAPVPVGIVEALVAFCDASELLRFDKVLKPGLNVKVLAGPFAGFIGELETIDAAGRVRILLAAMGAKIPLMTTSGMLEPAD
jgi:transcription antitermination factor NusG